MCVMHGRELCSVVHTRCGPLGGDGSFMVDVNVNLIKQYRLCDLVLVGSSVRLRVGFMLGPCICVACPLAWCGRVMWLQC